MKKLQNLRIQISNNFKQRWPAAVRVENKSYSVRQLELMVRSMNLQRMP